MNQKEPTKTFMMISNWKNPLVSMVQTNIIQRFRVETHFTWKSTHFEVNAGKWMHYALNLGDNGDMIGVGLGLNDIVLFAQPFISVYHVYIVNHHDHRLTLAAEWNIKWCNHLFKSWGQHFEVRSYGQFHETRDFLPPCLWCPRVIIRSWWLNIVNLKNTLWSWWCSRCTTMCTHWCNVVHLNW